MAQLKPQNELSLIVAYYLSRLDKDAPASLGFKTFNEAARQIGKILDVKPSTVKNMRDEFDYHLENSRIGWRRELRGSRLKALQTFQMTSDSELLEIVKEILENNDWVNTESYKDIQLLLADNGEASSAKKDFVLRGPTGKGAENYFMERFDKYPIPMDGKLIDCRDMGCGYDFKIEAKDRRDIFVEVKGLAGEEGSILFTDKEWQTAKEHGENYYLAIVRNISRDAIVELIQDPASRLEPKRSINTIVQVSWNVSKNMLQRVSSFN